MEKVTIFDRPDPDSGVASHIEYLQSQNCLVDTIDNIEITSDKYGYYITVSIYYRKPEKKIR